MAMATRGLLSLAASALLAQAATALLIAPLRATHGQPTPSREGAAATTTLAAAPSDAFDTNAGGGAADWSTVVLADIPPVFGALSAQQLTSRGMSLFREGDVDASVEACSE